MAPRVKYNDDGTVTVTLKHPITFKGKEITAVTMRTEAGIGDVEEMEQAAAGKKLDAGIRLAAALSSGPSGPGVHRLAIRAMKMSDIIKLIEVASKSISVEDDDTEEGQEEGNGAGPSTGGSS